MTQDHGYDDARDVEREGCGDNVVYLPTTTGDGVVEGELVPDTDTARTAEPVVRETFGTRRIVPVEARERMATGALELSHRAAPVVTSGGKAVVRHAVYVAQGTAAVVKRWRDAHGASRYERRMRTAEAAGDEEALRYWQEADVAEKQRRHQRTMDWFASPLLLAKAFAVGIASLAGLLLALGIVLAIADSDAGMVLAPIGAAIDTVRWVWWFLAAYGFVLVNLALAAVVAYVWNEGRKRAEPPRWVAPGSVGDAAAGRDVVPDEGAILTALRHLGLAELNKAIKDGWQPRWVSATGRLGNGWHTQLQLPLGVTVEKIADRKNVLAHNLMRKPIEVWPTEPRNQPGVLDLWVADQGILSGPVPAWPLLHSGRTDFFKGVPVAVDARGEQVTAQLMARNYLIAGIMGSGKSSLVIALLLGAMLDPLVDIDVHVLAYNVDYDPMRPRLRTLVKGDDEEHIAAAMDTLRALVSEVSRRGKVMEDLGGEDAKLTREIAEADPSMRPRIVVFDEVHELFTHKTYGEEAKELALKLTKKARKTGIVLLWITPDADAASLPRGISKTASNCVAFAINDHQGNDAILGTGMHKRGYSATTLVAGEDVGTAMAKGFSKVPGLIRSHYIRKEKGTDEITPVVQRALALREDAGITTPVPGIEPPERLDPLADIAAVLNAAGASRMRTQEVLQRLAERNPAAYRDWTFTDLTAELADTPAAPYKSGGHMVISAARVREAITERDQDEADEAEGGM